MKNKKAQIAIIDDDYNATQKLIEIITDYPDFQILWTAGSIAEGKKLLKENIPDVLFLDIELPDGFGLTILDDCKEILKNKYVIVFTGYYECYSEKAFTHNECDYLLKPILPKEFDKCIQRFRHSELKSRISSLSADVPIQQMVLPVGTFAALTYLNEVRIVRVHEIGYFKYSSTRRVWEVALIDNSFVQLKKGANAESILAFDSQFLQTHQSYIVNMRYLTLIKDNKCILFPPFEEDEILLGRKFKTSIQDKIVSI